MELATVSGIKLEFEVQGSGEPVVLVHGSILADSDALLMRESALTERYRIIRYHRCGFAGSEHLAPPVSIAQQAEHCRALMRHLNIERTHVVGYDYGGLIALQLALDAPDAVHSLSLFEPQLLGPIPSGQQFLAEQFINEGATSVQKMYNEGNKSEAIDTFLRLVCGQEYRKVIDQVLSPNAFERVMADIDTFFRVEVPAGRPWEFTREAAERIKQPVLSVVGANSTPMFWEVHKMVLDWLPQSEEFVLPNSTHLLQMMNPRDIAKGLASFFTRHPLGVVMSAPASIMIDDLLNTLVENSFSRDAGIDAISGFIDSLWDYADSHRPDPTQPWETETYEGMGFSDLLRDIHIVRMADEDLLSLDDAERVLSIIEDTISEKSQKTGGAVRFGDLGEFTFIGKVSHELTPAERAWLAKMEEETYVDDEDERGSRELLEAVKRELQGRSPSPRFRIRFLP